MMVQVEKGKPRKKVLIIRHLRIKRNLQIDPRKYCLIQLNVIVEFGVGSKAKGACPLLNMPP